MKKDLVILINCARDHYDVCIEISKRYPDVDVLLLWSDEYTKNLIYNQHRSDNISYNYEEIYNENIIKKYKSIYNIKAVIPSGDDSVELAFKLQKELTPEISNSTYTIELIKDKSKYLDFLREKGLVFTKQYDIDKIDSFPVVIKPKVSKGGSENVWLVNSTNELPKNIDKDFFVAQEYMKGIEYTIDIASYNGEHHLLLATKYKKNDGEFWQYCESIVDYYNERYFIDEIYEYICQCLDALSWKFGISCTQIIAGDKIGLVEINFRKHGHIHDKAVEMSTGVKLSTHVADLYLNPEIFKNRLPVYDYYQPYDRFWINIEKETFIEKIDWSSIENLKSFVKKTDHSVLFNLPNMLSKSTSMLSSLGMISFSHKDSIIYNQDIEFYKLWYNNLINK